MLLRSGVAFLALLVPAALVAADETFVSQPPGSGLGIGRSSQLWQDPGPDGNDLDGDAVCFQDFVLSTETSIRRIEWWGIGACELGFRIQVWRQDPGTIAYQPIAVFYYGGSPTPPVPNANFDTTAYSVSPGPGGTLHYTLVLDTPIVLPANNAQNPRWFISVIGLTHQAFAQWKWAQGFGGSSHSYWFIRGEGPSFFSLGDGRALVLGKDPPACPADLNGDGTVGAPDLGTLLSQWGTAGSADLDHDGIVNAADMTVLLGSWGGC